MSKTQDRILEKLRLGEKPESLAKEYKVPLSFVKKWLSELEEGGEVYEGPRRELMNIRNDLAELDTDDEGELKEELDKVAVKLAKIGPQCVGDKDLAKSYADVVNALSNMHTSFFGKGDTNNTLVYNGMPAGFKKFLGD